MFSLITAQVPTAQDGIITQHKATITPTREKGDIQVHIKAIGAGNISLLRMPPN